MSKSETVETSTQDVSSSDAQQNDIVLRGYGLKRYYPITAGALKRHVGDVKAVDEVDVEIRRGQTLGLVGESGCGKSTLARMLVKLDEPTEGAIYYNLPEELSEEVGELEAKDASERTREEKKRLSEIRKQYEINSLSGKQAKSFRRNAQFVFQNPTSSLNPRKLIKDIVSKPLRVHTDLSPVELEEKTIELLEEVGLGEDFLYRYPHMLSGGQKQRVAIARSIALNPDIVVLDEPTSALDVSVQAQIVNLLEDIQDRFDLTYLFITHDLSVVRHVADDISVMYLGKMVEHTSCETLFTEPKHPYTEALISSSPAVRSEDRIRLEGDVPDAENPPMGCTFHTRCHKAEAMCGWNGRDLLALLKERADRDEVIADVYEGISETEFDGYTAKFTFDRSVPIDQIEAVVSGRDDRLQSQKPVLFEAITDIEVNGKAITIDFLESSPPVPIQDGPGHHVSCLLYEDS